MEYSVSNTDILTSSLLGKSRTSLLLSMPPLRVFGSCVWNLFHHDDGRHRIRQIQRHRQGIQRHEDHPWKGDHCAFSKSKFSFYHFRANFV
jgi:hypothetical protein